MIACFKCIRGAIALYIAGTLFLASLHIEDFSDNKALSNTQEDAFLSLIVQWFPQLGKDHLIALGILSLFLAVIRFAEALGIWFDKSWGEKLAIATGVLASCLLMGQLLSSFSWLIFLIFIINVLVVIYLYIVLKNKN